MHQGLLEGTTGFSLGDAEAFGKRALGTTSISIWLAFDWAMQAGEVRGYEQMTRRTMRASIHDVRSGPPKPALLEMTVRSCTPRARMAARRWRGDAGCAEAADYDGQGIFDAADGFVEGVDAAVGHS